MQSTQFDLSQDCFIIDRDQDDYLQMPQAQSTPRSNFAEQSFRIENLYEIIKTEDGHIVLHHDTANTSLLHTAQGDNPTFRRFTLHNPIVPDDIFMSPPRNYEEMANWLYSPNDGTISPVSSDNSSIGFFSGSDWSTDSSWISYDSLVQSVFNTPISSPFRPISTTSSYRGRSSRKPGTVAAPTELREYKLSRNVKRSKWGKRPAR